MANAAESHDFKCSGRIFPASEIALIREVVATCRGLSRKELANTISELVGWTRANGLLKEAECLMLLTRLEAAGLLTLPAKQQTRPVGSSDFDSAHGWGRSGRAAERAGGNVCSRLG